jgi:hypothetical protein
LFYAWDGWEAAFVAALNALDIAVPEQMVREDMRVADGGKRVTMSDIKSGKIAATA